MAQGAHGLFRPVVVARQKAPGMSKNPGSLARPAGRAMQTARHDAERAALPGRQDRAVPLAVDLRGVHKHFGSVQAVRGVALTIGSGEVMAFLGPNGAGKTSTIDMILGLSRPDAGAVEVYGMAPRQAVRKGLVSAVIQAFRRQPPSRGGAGTRGHHRDRGPPGREVLGGRTTAAALRHGADP